MKRIIPRIDIKGNNLVKGFRLEGLRVLGDPNDFAYEYYRNGADELIFQDVVASLYSRESLYDVIKKAAKEIFIPITVGGGIKNIEEISKILKSGADKVSINSAGIRNPEFIYNAINKFGSSTIASNVELVKMQNHTYFSFTDNGRNNSNIDALTWIKQLCDMKIGEIILTFVDTEGTGKGIDINFIKEVEKIINCPLIVHGGVGNKGHVAELINQTNIDGVVIASLLHYNIYDKFDNTKVTSGNIDFLKNKKKPKIIDSCSIFDLKKYLSQVSDKIIIHN